ncbi:polysaccharide deacetylase [Thermovirga lienii DSM 17291]|uniref:Polysaccharide deacetylase n=2 Tax=Thermovirga TaxID=336260 RepID=G7V7U9_THELD|nr:polysaccharide deacetylase [Thermovirga lienii DSM 17291]MDN5368083.1 peptidoglycan-N-acetylglucosamine deacetylase [Thermovirga sp.]HCD72497.1 polysaccharide deacetylase family protein [Thermovirga lienii]
MSPPLCLCKKLITLVIVMALLIAEPSCPALALNPISHGPNLAKTVALTFDDGPHPWHTPQLLDMLETFQVRATFFVVGIKCAENPLLLKEIAERGHTIANHSWSHPNLVELEDEKIEEQIRLCNQAIEGITGRSCHFFRPPGGNWDSRTLKIAEKMGLRTVLWTINSYDTGDKSLTAVEEAQMVTRKTTPGAIILLHDGGNFTLEALPHIITTLTRKGYSFVTLEEMFQDPPKPINLNF